jgi:hypothetical protein
MSKTRKDLPARIRIPEKFSEVIEDSFIFWIKEFPGVRTKKKRHYYEVGWMPTPMWWIHLKMNAPQRGKGKVWEGQVVRMPIDSLIDVDLPNVSRKPHPYFW